MYLTTKPGILKAITLVLGLIVTAVGCNAVLNSDLYAVRTEFEFACKLIRDCPSGWLTMERFFVGTSITFFLLSIVSFALGFVMDISCSGKKTLDAAYHVIGGILLLTGAALLITSALKLDKEITFGPITDKLVIREAQKYPEKLAAGVLGIFNGLLYLVATGIIYMTQPN